ncbi:MAG: hypothetical protein KDE09_13490 [Anaerolineales bacterium]|nr:hypothetical protein [Anaerolineales bacterium]MCB0031907.1 hypothetical protein [Anaerolineales bacterium]
MPTIPPEVFKQIQTAICRPEGTVTFEYYSKDLFDRSKQGGLLFQIPSGEHLFRLERDDSLLLHFYHSSPGTGTRVATINLNEVPSSDRVFMCFSWTPAEIKLYLGSRVSDGKLFSASGFTSQKQLRVGRDGSVYQVGDRGIEVMGVSVYKAGKPILQSTALEAWKETIKATEILATGQSDQGYIFETAVTNLTLAVLVTGFEAYTKKRFLELEQEGIAPNLDAVINSFFPRKERDANIGNVLNAEANDKQITVLQLIVERDVINFQNYQKCKLAYNKAFRVKFGDLGLESSTLEKIKKFITYRHRIIHVSALLGLLNQAEVPVEEPVFPKKELADQAMKEFDNLIEKLHEATLKLRRKD